MAKEKVNAESILLTPSAVINLFKLDASNIGVQAPYFFYAGTNNNNQAIIFDGIQYTPIPLELSEYEVDGQGRLPRPKITIANINGVISNLILEKNDLSGCLVNRRRVFVKYIDNANFPGGANPWGTADPEACFSDETFFINRKLQENNQTVTFELSTPWEIDNVKLPKRPIYALICSFQYRQSDTCGFSGPPIADKSNSKFVESYSLTLNSRGEWSASETYNSGDWVYIKSILPTNYGDIFYYVCMQNGITGSKNKPGLNTYIWRADQCPKNLAGCKIRFPSGTLPFGGFPGVARSKLL